MKNKSIKALMAAAALMAGTPGIIHAQNDSVKTDQVHGENPFKKLTDDKKLTAAVMEELLLSVFPELNDELHGADIATTLPIVSVEEVRQKALSGAEWETEDIYALYRLEPAKRLAFFKSIEADKKRIPIFAEGAFLLMDGMTPKQIDAYCQIDIRPLQGQVEPCGQSDLRQDMETLIDAVFEMYNAPCPFYLNTPQPIIKNKPAPKPGPQGGKVRQSR